MVLHSHEIDSALPGGVIPVTETVDSGGYPARHQELKGQFSDWLAWHQFTVTKWDSMFDLPHLSRCSSTLNCPCRAVPNIHVCIWLGC